MSRLNARTSSGARTPLLAAPARQTRSKIQLTDTLFEDASQFPNSRTPSPPINGRRGGRRPQVLATESDGSNTQEGDEDAEDEDDEDDDTDDSEPALFTPSHAYGQHATGHSLVPYPFDLGSAPSGHNNSFWDEDEDDDDDDTYDAVNDIPDDDDESEEIDPADLLAMMVQDEDFNQDFLPVDNISEILGFAEEYEGPWASSSDNDDHQGRVPSHRHVRFDEPPSSPTRLLNGSVSPLLTRALLSSALPDIPTAFSTDLQHSMAVSNTSQLGAGVEEDPYDSDATVLEDSMPIAGLTSAPSTVPRNDPRAGQIGPSPGTQSGMRSPEKGQKKRRRNGAPPLGVFDVDDDKPWAMLDPSGKQLEIVPCSAPSHPAWLVKAIEASQGPGTDSGAASPTSLYYEESESGELLDMTMEDVAADPMLVTSTDSQGQAVGPLETFYAPQGLPLTHNAQLNAQRLLGDLDPGPEFGDLPIDMSTFVSFESDSCEEDELEVSPEDTPRHHNPDSHFYHLTGNNLTSFRNNADQANAAMANGFASNAKLPPLHTPGPGSALGHRKRKSTNSPFSSPRYTPATPVLRVLRATPKRRRIGD